MSQHSKLLSPALRSLIRNKEITYAGNIPAKIYGTLACASGKRMKEENRIFFSNASEAINAGYRPCGKCLGAEYERWKKVNKTRAI